MHSTGTCMYTITYAKATLPSTWVRLGFVERKLSADTLNPSSTRVQVAVRTCSLETKER